MEFLTETNMGTVLGFFFALTFGALMLGLILTIFRKR